MGKDKLEIFDVKSPALKTSGIACMSNNFLNYPLPAVAYHTSRWPSLLSLLYTLK